MSEPKTNLEKEFATTTTCHGVSYWYTSESKWLRAFWILLVLGMFSALVSQIAIRIMTYYEYATSTDITEEFVSYLSFPAVTICSFNRYYLHGSQKELYGIHALNGLTSPASVAFKMKQNQKVNLTLIEQLLGKDMNITEYTNKYGFSIEDRFMPMCRFKTGNCDSEDFKPVLTSMGRCYTFNEGKNSRTQNIPGAGHGLTVIVDTRHDLTTEEPLEGKTEAGIKLQIHPQYEEPDVETYGVTVPVGQKAYIEMEQTDNEIMYRPWGKCDPKTESLKYFENYTLQNCLQECYTDAVIEKCNCRLYTQYWAANYAPECTIKEMYNCSAKYYVKIKQNYSASDCNCTVPCTFTEFSLSIAYATFPNNPTSERIEKDLNKTKSDVSENLLKFEIYFKRMSYRIFSQSKKVDESSLLSDIGGQLGLWIGMSIITVFEIFQYFVKKIAFVCRRSSQTQPGATHNNTVKEEKGRSSTNT